jgi:hypothetical protein
VNPDFDELLRQARKTGACAECGGDLSPTQRTTSTFCSRRCGSRFRDRRRYAENPEERRAKARAYYQANRELVLERTAARRARQRGEDG